MSALPRTADDETRRFAGFWRDEMTAAALYRAIADVCEGERREVFRALAETESRHARHWERVLARRGVEGLEPPRLPLRERVLVFLAHRLGVESVIPVILRAEAADAAKYEGLAAAEPSMSAQERAHGRVLAAMTDGEQTVGERITRVEGRHRISAGGALRASVFGVNDGLVSNLGLVIGVAGGTDDGGIVMLAGLVGLLAGALSMAGGEWISVQSQRELYQREIAVEAAELEQFPDEERGELVLIYRAKGIPREEADALADQIMERPETALDTLAREELGIDPASLGSPLVAAGSSFLSFALGAVVPVLPFVFSSGGAAVGGALGLSGLGLAGAGAMTSVFTGRSLPRTSLRMVALGAVIAAVTYGLGSVVGVAIE